MSRRARTDYPSGVIGIYDNRGKTVDRYAIVYEPFDVGNEKWWDVLTMSPDPFWPQGVCMHGESRYRPVGLGKVIAFTDLPPDCQKAVERDLAGSQL